MRSRHRPAKPPRHRLRSIATLLLPSLLLGILATNSGCSGLRFPAVHRITIQQGNVITQKMIDRLRPGMTKSQVEFVLGRTMVQTTLNENRWDYVYTVHQSGGTLLTRKLSLYFIDGRLSHFHGDFKPGEEDPAS